MHRASLQHRSGVNDHQGPHRHPLAQLSRGIDHGAGVHTGERLRTELCGPPLGEPGEVEIGIGADDHRTTLQGLVGQCG